MNRRVLSEDPPQRADVLRPDRLSILFEEFAHMGIAGGYGKTDLAAELWVSPQIVRRRASEARRGCLSRSFPLDQLMQIAQIAVREIERIQDLSHQVVMAWLLGLDALLNRNQIKKLAAVRRP